VSGFVIAHLLITKQEKYLTYIARRALRLFPLFITVSVIAIVVYYVFGVKSSSASYDTWILSLALNATMLHGIIPDELLKDASRALINPGWSISLEWQFYLLAPLLFVKNNRLLSIVLLILFAFLVTGGYLNRKSLGLSYPHASFLVFSIHYFLIGIFSYWLHIKLKKDDIVVSTLNTFVLAFLTYAITKNYAISIWICFFCLFLLRKPRVNFNFMKLNILVSLGKVSFSTYLIHYVVIQVLVKYLIGHFDKSSFGLLISLGFLTVLITIPLSFLLYKYIELPCINFGRNYFKRSGGDV